MIYLTDEDLNLESFERFINESTANDDTVKNKAETAIIGIVKTFLNNYDVVDIFNPSEPIRDEYLASIMATMVVHKLLGRNAARKLNQDGKDDYNNCIKQLTAIQTGKVILDLPPKLDDAGNSTEPIMWGNNTNQDFYI
ncbi:MAG: phage protein Gp36 family protein [Candidatus Methylacidiphilales bacterium]